MPKRTQQPQSAGYWSAIAKDPHTPDALRVEAKKHLGSDTAVPAAHNKPYDATLDALVENLWGRRWGGLEEPDPRAVSLYRALACCILCGGVAATARADAEQLLDVFAACRSEWMRKKTSSALSSLAVLHAEALGQDFCERIGAVLEPTPKQETEYQ